MRGPRIAILTVQQHMQERWVTALQAALEAQGAAVELLDARSLTLSLDTPPAADVLVNRVSDAADPALCKFVRAYLQLMDVRGQRVVNGHRCYGIGASKVLHHAALQACGLATPKTHVVRSGDGIRDAAPHLRFPLLLKPNAGGMGQGVRRFDTAEELQAAVRDAEPDLGSDGVGLLQEYHAPRDGVVHRVFVMGGKVQMAVKVHVGESFNTCMCSLQRRDAGAAQEVARAPPAVAAHACPDDVAADVVSVMEYCGADVGSVEYVVDAATGAAVYFDVNMLSTLPDPSMTEGAEVWGAECAPWADFARFVVSKAA